MEQWDKTNKLEQPSLEVLSSYVNTPLWSNLCDYVENEFQSKPILEYSSCSMQRGWNLKYKKAGRSLCTLYPMENFFIALIVIGQAEATETELMLPTCSEYFQQLYQDTKTGMGQKWLMLPVTEEAVLEDIKKCIRIRRWAKSKH